MLRIPRMDASLFMSLLVKAMLSVLKSFSSMGLRLMATLTSKWALFSEESTNCEYVHNPLYTLRWSWATGSLFNADGSVVFDVVVFSFEVAHIVWPRGAKREGHQLPPNASSHCADSCADKFCRRSTSVFHVSLEFALLW